MENIEIVLGTYENHLLGYKFDAKSDGGYSLSSSFTDDSHCGAIRCVTVSRNGILASSSTDDSIRLHNLKNRKEVGGLFQHEGSVNCIRFFKGGHMFSAGEDNTICLWKARKWELLRVLKGHKTHVMAMAVHPTGKLGLSVGSDRSLFTWDLTTGKLAFRRKIADVAQDIMFTKDGNHYILVYHKKIEICSLENTDVVQEISMDYRINSVCFVEPDVLAIGGDDRYIQLTQLFDGQQILKVDAAKEGSDFTGRVRALSVIDSGEQKLLVIGMSNGSIKICQLHMKEGDSCFDGLLYYETNVRLTCMAVYKSGDTLDEKEAETLTVSAKSKKPNTKMSVFDEPTENTNGSSDSCEDESDEETGEVEDTLEQALQESKVPDKRVKRKKKRSLNKKGTSDVPSTQSTDRDTETSLGSKRKAKPSKNKSAAKKKKQSS